MNYEDEVARVIRAKYAPDFATALQDADIINVISGTSRVTVPLRADAKVLVDKNLGAVILRGHILADIGATHGRQVFSSEAVFSTREIKGAREAEQVVSHMFNHLRDNFIRKLVAKEFEIVPFKA